jgi:hypothetical protein
VDIKEAFIDVIPAYVKTAEIITAEIRNKPGRDGLNLEGCRAQFYENQVTMAGVHSRGQKRILDPNQLAVFNPCNNHSPSLVVLHLLN